MAAVNHMLSLLESRTAFHSMDRWLLAAFPFAAHKKPPTNHVSHSSTDCVQTSFRAAVFGPATNFNDAMFNHQLTNQTIMFLCFDPFCRTQTATSSLLFQALLPAVHHPSQTALFFAPIRQQPIFKGSFASFPFEETVASCSLQTTTNSVFPTAVLTAFRHPSEAALFGIHFTATTFFNDVS
ncbi:Uncharacterized protein APZ42_013493 [Daphnia magna]|uniref:Uncharacterized protein n=1 Tax=Daphnia magna TaxID=35525 RepID=A0A162QTT1_9CRUS|nr:Uncharacterized protein APZ42_013493 [Daphnia magna]